MCLCGILYSLTINFTLFLFPNTTVSTLIRKLRLFYIILHGYYVINNKYILALHIILNFIVPDYIILHYYTYFTLLSNILK